MWGARERGREREADIGGRSVRRLNEWNVNCAITHVYTVSQKSILPSFCYTYVATKGMEQLKAWKDIQCYAGTDIDSDITTTNSINEPISMGILANSVPLKILPLRLISHYLIRYWVSVIACTVFYPVWGPMVASGLGGTLMTYPVVHVNCTKILYPTMLV